jgi:hypothetical protein
MRRGGWPCRLVLVGSRRQQGWIAKGDTLLFNQAITHFTKKLTSDPKANLREILRGGSTW